LALPIALSRTLFSVADRIYTNMHKIFHTEYDSTAHYFMIYVVMVIVLVLLLLLLLLLVVVSAAAAIGKAIPLQAWKGPDGSRRLRLPDFKTIST